jgi:regulator of protease activity HflC (stomatin/prohibitin superfamily)
VTVIPVGSLVCVCGAVLFVTIIVLALGIRIVPQGQRLSVHRMDQHIGDRGPGITFLIPIMDRGVLKKVDSNEVISVEGDQGNG